MKENREMRECYMIFEEMMEEERKAGREEGLMEGELRANKTFIFELLEDIGAISEELKTQIEKLNNENQLQKLRKLARKAKTVEDFSYV